MITTYLKAPPFEYISLIVGAQAMVLLALSVLVAALMIHRNWRARRLERYRTDFSATLVEDMMYPGETARTTPPTWWQFLRARAFKLTLLDHLKSIAGPEKLILKARYAELGFVRHDLRMTRSWAWWRRLQAIANLSLLDEDAHAQTFDRMTKDRHDLVAAFAFVSLSRLAHPLNFARPVAEIPLAVLGRENVLHEVLRNWARVHGHGYLITQMLGTRRPELLQRLVRALAAEPTPDVAEAFSRKLREPGLGATTLEELLALVAQVGDPASAAAVRPYLEHDQPGVRLRALEYFVTLGDHDALAGSRILHDDSVAIRRVLKSLQIPEAA